MARWKGLGETKQAGKFHCGAPSNCRATYVQSRVTGGLVSLVQNQKQNLPEESSSPGTISFY